jgi:hypothetical protein
MQSCTNHKFNDFWNRKLVRHFGFTLPKRHLYPQHAGDSDSNIGRSTSSTNSSNSTSSTSSNDQALPRRIQTKQNHGDNKWKHIAEA